jgi:hypothetical protein
MEIRMSNSSRPTSPQHTRASSRREMVAQTEETLTQLMRILPLVQAHNRLEEWAALYTNGLILKLRAMR